MNPIMAVYTIIKAWPTLKSWVESFMKFYVEREIANMKKEDREAIKKAINEQDQRDLEKQIGYSKAGEASGLPGAVIVDSLPNVGMPKKK